MKANLREPVRIAPGPSKGFGKVRVLESSKVETIPGPWCHWSEMISYETRCRGRGEIGGEVNQMS